MKPIDLAQTWVSAVRLPLMARLWMRLEVGIDPPDETLLDDALDDRPIPRARVPLDRFVGALVAVPAGDLSGCAGLFEVAETDVAGAQCLACGVLDPATGDLVDIVAWRPADPSRWRLLTGAGVGLGTVRETDDEIPLYPTPHARALALQAGWEDGLVALRRTPALLRQALLRYDGRGKPRRLVVPCGDRDFAAALTAAMAAGRLPEIVA